MLRGEARYYFWGENLRLDAAVADVRSGIDSVRRERNTADANRRAILAAQRLESWWVEKYRIRQFKWQRRAEMCHVSVYVLRQSILSIFERRAFPKTEHMLDIGKSMDSYSIICG